MTSRSTCDTRLMAREERVCPLCQRKLVGKAAHRGVTHRMHNARSSGAKSNNPRNSKQSLESQKEI